MKTIIETPRLILREVDPEADFEAWADCFSDLEVMAGLGGGPGMSRAQAWRHMATVIGHQSIHGYSFYSVIEKASGDWVGRVGHWNPEGWPEPEVGWTIHRPFGAGVTLKKRAKPARIMPLTCWAGRESSIRFLWIILRAFGPLRRSGLDCFILSIIFCLFPMSLILSMGKTDP